MRAAKFRDVDRVLRKLGYRPVRTTGSHIMYSKPDTVVVIRFEGTRAHFPLRPTRA